MSIIPIATANGGTGGAATATIVIPTVQVNDFLLAAFTNKGAAAVPTVGDDDSGTWARLDGAGINGASVWWRWATSATSAKTITASGFTTANSGGLQVYRGVDPSITPYANVTVASQASGTESIAGFTPSRMGSEICLAVFNRNIAPNCTAQSSTNPGTLAERFDILATGGCGVMLASNPQVNAAAATGNLTWAQTNSAHITIIFSLLAARTQPPRTMYHNRMRRAA